MPLVSTSSDHAVLNALHYVVKNRRAKGEWLPSFGLELTWITDKWRPLVAITATSDKPTRGMTARVSRCFFELCVFTQVMLDLKAGDLAVVGGNKYADYRLQLLSLEDFAR